MKKIISLLISLFIVGFVFVPAFADREVVTRPDITLPEMTTQETTSEAYSGSWETVTFAETEEDTTVEDLTEATTRETTTEPTTFPDNYEEPYALTQNFEVVEETEPVTTTGNEETAATALTTIYLKGVSIETTMTIKNMSTGKKYKIVFNEDNGFTGSFDGPEGKYKLVSLSTGLVAIRNGRVYDDEGNKIKTIEIKRVNNWQVLTFTSSERAHFNIFLFMKQHWLLLSLFVIACVAYRIVKKNRVLPSQPNSF